MPAARHAHHRGKVSADASHHVVDRVSWVRTNDHRRSTAPAGGGDRPQRAEARRDLTERSSDVNVNPAPIGGGRCELPARRCGA